MSQSQQSPNSGESRFRLSKLLSSTLVRRSSLCVAVLVLTFVSASAQSATREQRQAAVAAVVSAILLDEPARVAGEPNGRRVNIDLNQRLGQTYQVNNGRSLYAAFEAQKQEVEFCLFISSPAPISNGAVVVEVNGVARNVSAGENCFKLAELSQQTENYINLIVNAPGVTVTLSTLELQSTSQTQLTLPRLTRGEWNNDSVRKVIKIFAFGGHAADQQIQTWADMRPQDAIVEMLNFNEHNLKLSPLSEGDRYPQTATQFGTLTAFAGFLSNSASDLPIPQDLRAQYAVEGDNFDDTFVRMVTTRGLNPFRQRIGFWETNYHMAVNFEAMVSNPQMAFYYDAIMKAHESGVPYHQVMGVAAKSAAIATQYGHHRNQWVFDPDLGEYVCLCNEDFAREIHQLFFGIFGKNDPNHEDVTIPQTARMLTGMGPFSGFPTEVTFTTDRHHTGDLTILGRRISGANAAQKIDNLMPISINHPESLANLPSMIISTLADDNLSPNEVAQINAAWASMGDSKNLLRFLQGYAISELFHSRNQAKYLTSHERAFYLANKFNTDNFESYYGGNFLFDNDNAGREVDNIIDADGAGNIFRPLNNVFGGQTSQEASESALAFELNYNLHTLTEIDIRDAVQCERCDQGDPWLKNWPTVLPKRADGNYYVADVAPWLWRHVVGSMRNYGELERAHLYTLLGAVRRRPGHENDQNLTFDLPLLMCIVEDYQRRVPNADISLSNLMGNGAAWFESCRIDDGNGQYSAAEQAALNRVFTEQDIANDPVIQSLLTQMGQVTFDFNASGQSNSPILRQRSRERVNSALGFIFTTPYVFAEGQ